MLTSRVVPLSILLICSCADPRPPTGGPRDETPPALVSTEPPHESVEVSPTELRLVFSEYVNEGSFARALSILPTPQGRLRYRWRGRSVTIRLPEPLRDSTTYVVTLDDEFRDWHGIRLTRPLSFAFATGPVIDQGRLRGRIVDHTQGMPVSGVLVLAYPFRSAIDGNPAYQTQTDTEGQFEFNYVRDADFFVFGLQDINRNLTADPGEWFAVPPVAAITAMPNTSQEYSNWIYTRIDTLGPSVERVRTTANELVEIRFNEKVALQNLTGKFWSMMDSVNSTPVTVHSSYQLESNSQVVYLATDPLQERTYAVLPDPSIQDSSGNTVRMDSIFFMATLRESSSVPVFEKFLPASTGSPYQLAPWETPQVVFNQSVEENLLDSLVSIQDSTGSMVSFEVQSTNGTTYSLAFLDAPAQIYRVTVKQPDSIYVQLFERLGPRSLGSVSGMTVPSGDSVFVTLANTDGLTLATERTDTDGNFIFNDLPANSFHLRAFIDRNQNGQWDGGLVDPYQAAEPITWATEPITVRPRWDTALPDTLIIGQSSKESFPATDQ